MNLQNDNLDKKNDACLCDDGMALNDIPREASISSEGMTAESNFGGEDYVVTAEDPEIAVAIAKRRRKKQIRGTLFALCCLMVGNYIAVFIASIVFYIPIIFLPFDEKVGGILEYAAEIPVFACQLLVPALVFLLIKRKGPGYYTRLDVDTKQRATPLFVLRNALIAFTISCSFSFVAGIITSIFGLDEAAFEIQTASTWYEYLMDVISIAILPAVLEEFVFRGIVLKELLPYGKSFALVTSALLFASLHGSAQQMLYSFVYGLFFALIAMKTGSLKAGMMIHFLNNFYSCSIDYMLKIVPESIADTVTLVTQAVLITAGFICVVVSVAQNRFAIEEKDDPESNGHLDRKQTFAQLICPVTVIYFLLMIGETYLTYLLY